MTSEYAASAMERLMGKAERLDTGCWLWLGAVTGGGYGKTYILGKYVDAHRASWALHRGPVPSGHVVAHRCDVRRCINPEHLFVATQAENLADMRAKARGSRGPAHAEAIRAGWTPQLRQRRREQTAARMAARSESQRIAAGAPDGWKRCGMCQEWMPMDAFHRNAAKPDGRHNRCRRCRSGTS